MYSDYCTHCGHSIRRARFSCRRYFSPEPDAHEHHRHHLPALYEQTPSITYTLSVIPNRCSLLSGRKRHALTENARPTYTFTGNWRKTNQFIRWKMVSVGQFTTYTAVLVTSSYEQTSHSSQIVQNQYHDCEE